MRRPVGHRLLSIIGPVAISLAVAGPSEAAGRAGECGGNKVPVKVGKKTTCQPLDQAIPKPTQIDPRLAYTRAAIGLDAGLKKKVGREGAKALGKLAKVLPRGLDAIDEEAPDAAAGRSARDRGAAIPLRACSLPPLELVGELSGVRVSAATGPNGAEGGSFEYRSGGLTYITRFRSCGGKGWSIDECPTASGDVRASRVGKPFEVTIEVRDGARVIFRQSNTFTDKTKARGKVGGDARLEHIDFDDTEEVFIVATGGIVLRGTAERHVRVEMPAGTLNAGGARVKLSGDTAAIKKSSTFAGRIGEAIEVFRRAESGPNGWAAFGRAGGDCAKPVFFPESNTLTLPKGSQGELTLFAEAKNGGGQPTEARWELLEPRDATFTPTSSTQPAPVIDYTVASSPQGSTFGASVRLRSTAGVGRATWTEGIAPDEITHIGGTISGTRSSGGVIFSIVGALHFDRGPSPIGGPSGPYDLAAGSGYTVTASGRYDGLDCRQSGSEHFTLPPGSGGLSVEGTFIPQPPYFTAPYTYYFRADHPNETMTVTLSGCAAPDEDQEGSTREVYPPIFIDTFDDPQISEDGVNYTASGVDGGTDLVLDWEFVGS